MNPTVPILDVQFGSPDLAFVRIGDLLAPSRRPQHPINYRVEGITDHLLMFAEVGGPLLAGMFLNINALIIAMMIVAFRFTKATAFWDASYVIDAADRRSPVEQHVHSFLEMIPLVALISVISLHWGQFLARLRRRDRVGEVRSRMEARTASYRLHRVGHGGQSCCSSCCPTWKSSSGACAPMPASWFQ